MWPTDYSWFNMQDCEKVVSNIWNENLADKRTTYTNTSLGYNAPYSVTCAHVLLHEGCS